MTDRIALPPRVVRPQRTTSNRVGWLIPNLALSGLATYAVQDGAATWWLTLTTAVCVLAMCAAAFVSDD